MVAAGKTGLATIISHVMPAGIMKDFSLEEKIILVQHAIKKYEDEEIVTERLKAVLSEKDIQRSIDTLLGTQRVRRIGPEILQNNESHTDLPDLPEKLAPVIDSL